MHEAWRRTLSLRGWLILLVVVVALPLSALAGIAVWRAHDTGRARVEDQLRDRARAMALVVDREFARVAIGLRTLANSAAVTGGDLDAAEGELRALSALLDGTPIGLSAADGRQLLSTTWEPGERRPGATAPPVTRGTFASGETAISDLVRSHNIGRMVTAVTVPVFPARQAAAGAGPSHVLAAALPEGRLAAVLRDSGGSQAPGWVAIVMDRTGIIVARTLREEHFLGKPVAPAFAARVARDGEGIQHDLVTYEGMPASFAFARAPRSGYAVVLSMPEAALRAPLRAMLAQVAAAAVLLLLAGAAAATLLARHIRRALHRLGQADPVANNPGSAFGGSTLREVDDLGRALALAAGERDRAVAGLATSERRFRALAEAGALVVWRGDASGAILEGEGWEELTGQPDAAFRGEGWLEVLHPEDRPATIAIWAAACAAGRPVDVEYRIRTRAGAWRWVRARGVPVAESAGAAAREWMGVVEDVEDRRLAERALAEREARLRLAVEAARLSTWEFDVEQGRGSRTGRADEPILAPSAAAFGLEAWAALIHPEDRDRTVAALRETIAGRTPHFAAEFRVRRRPPGEGWAWIASHGAVTERDPATGAARRIAGVAQDVSERREAEGRRILLAREVDHRAKNVLAVVQSVLRLVRRDRPEEFAAAVESRVGALARAHTLLSEKGWAGADLRALAEREMAGFPPGRTGLEGPPVALAAAAVQPLGMVLHELATNATKYGALSLPEGRVVLRWWREGEGLHLAWTESGGPPIPGPPARQGFGSRVIRTTVLRQLGGSLDLHWDAAGLRVAISLPAERVLAAGAPGPEPERRLVAAGRAGA